jgi:(2Fe-2S) ferredoxin
LKKYRLAVCKGPDCRRGGSEAVYQDARKQVAEQGLAERCQVARGGCYGLCHLGPNVVVREDTGRPKDPFSPEDYQLMGWEGEVHYGSMTPERLHRVLEEHVGEDRPVEDLRASPPGSR